MEASNISSKVIKDDEEEDRKFEDKLLLWKLYLGRKNAFEAMNNDVDKIVNECLAAKRHLQAVEDSNRNLKQEMRSLRSKYEALLEKNKKDTGIIMRLKDSESLLKAAVKNQRTTNDSLLEAQMKNKEKTLERNLLQDDRAKLVFKSQTTTNNLRKINLRHKHLYELILEENKKHKENDKTFIEETQQLKYILSKNDGILDQWLKNNAERDVVIHHLQDELKEGMKVYLDNSEESTADDTAEKEIEESSEKTDIPQSDEVKSTKERPKLEKKNKSKRSENKETEEQENREVAVRKEWLSKKTLHEVAEKQKEHFMNFYMVINKRMQDLNTEIVNVREWLLDKEAEKKEILEKTSAMEKLVSEKRRQKPVPLRTSTDEMKIWIEVQREANNALRKIAYKCLSVKLDDSSRYSEFAKDIRNMYLSTLKEQMFRKEQKEDDMTEKKEDEEET